MQAATQINRPANAVGYLSLLIALYLGCITLMVLMVVLQSSLMGILFCSLFHYLSRLSSRLNPQPLKRQFSKREWLIALTGAGLAAIPSFIIGHQLWPDDPFQWMGAMAAGIVSYGLGSLMVRDLRFALRHRQAAH